MLEPRYRVRAPPIPTPHRSRPLAIEDMSMATAHLWRKSWWPARSVRFAVGIEQSRPGAPPVGFVPISPFSSRLPGNQRHYSLARGRCSPPRERSDPCKIPASWSLLHEFCRHLVRSVELWLTFTRTRCPRCEGASLGRVVRRPAHQLGDVHGTPITVGPRPATSFRSATRPATSFQERYTASEEVGRRRRSRERREGASGAPGTCIRTTPAYGWTAEATFPAIPPKSTARRRSRRSDNCRPLTGRPSIGSQTCR
jgi:hypothetical protein